MVDHRPRYHLRPPAGWVNDPNAPVRVGDTYHLFCQFHPYAAVHSDIHWAHFTSTDLVRWRLHPPALVPGPGGPDADGCWSGTAVLVDGAPVLVYSGFRRPDEATQSVCLAWPDPGGPGWVKDPANPVLAGPPAGLGATIFRDPFVWRDGDGYTAVLGAGLGAGSDTPDRPVGAALLYRSPDLRRWRYVGPLCSATGPAFEDLATGTGWECPQLVRWDGTDQALLVVSAWTPERLGPVYAVGGRLDGDRLLPEAVGRLDHGPDFYAPVVLTEQGEHGGRHLVWGWSWEARPAQVAADEGWAGVLTLPRVLGAGPDGRPRLAPAPELQALRGEAASWEDVHLDPGRPVVLDPGIGDTFELAATLRPPAGGRAWLRVRSAPDGSEFTEIGVDAATGQAYLSRERASADPANARGTFAVDIGAGGPDRATSLRVYVDRSIIEVFVDDVSALTARVYPTRADSTGLAAGASAGVGLATVTAWPIETAAVEVSTAAEPPRRAGPDR